MICDICIAFSSVGRSDDSVSAICDSNESATVSPYLPDETLAALISLARPKSTAGPTAGSGADVDSSACSSAGADSGAASIANVSGASMERGFSGRGRTGVSSGRDSMGIPSDTPVLGTSVSAGTFSGAWDSDASALTSYSTSSLSCLGRAGSADTGASTASNLGSVMRVCLSSWSICSSTYPESSSALTSSNSLTCSAISESESGPVSAAGAGASSVTASSCSSYFSFTPGKNPASLSAGGSFLTVMGASLS